MEKQSSTTKGARELENYHDGEEPVLHVAHSPYLPGFLPALGPPPHPELRVPVTAPAPVILQALPAPLASAAPTVDSPCESEGRTPASIMPRASA